MEKINYKLVARYSGISILIMAVIAGFTAGYIPVKLFESNESSKIISNLKAFESLFNINLLGWFIIIVCDIFVSWGFYVLLRNINKNLALLSGWLRLFYTIVLTIAVFNLFNMDIVINSGSNSDISIYIKMFNKTWALGLIIFGLHLFLISVLMLKSKALPKVFGIFMFIASIGYILVNSFETFLPIYISTKSVIQLVFFIPMILGEVSFAIWLIIKGKLD